jgi:hypothetical protein
MTPVFDAYNNIPHTATKIASKKFLNRIHVLININKRAKKKEESS